MCVCLCLRVCCVSGLCVCMRACVRACVHASERVSERACERQRVCVREREGGEREREREREFVSPRLKITQTVLTRKSGRTPTGAAHYPVKIP